MRGLLSKVVRQVSDSVDKNREAAHALFILAGKDKPPIGGPPPTAPISLERWGKDPLRRP